MVYALILLRQAGIVTAWRHGGAMLSFLCRFGAAMEPSGGGRLEFASFSVKSMRHEREWP
jgi:hypothetical protein